jgi:hypothetical protein
MATKRVLLADVQLVAWLSDEECPPQMLPATTACSLSFDANSLDEFFFLRLVCRAF